MPDESPFFSIIVPAYNRAYILPETIQSVQQQKFTNWELIVVDDGSSDNTEELIRKLSESDKRIKYLYQQNAERSAARNNGARNANGSYFLFLDSDDAFHKEHLQNIFDFLTSKNFPICMVITNLLYIRDNQIQETTCPQMKDGKHLEYVLMNAITPTRVCLHRAIFEVFTFDTKIVIVEDLVLWTCIATTFNVFHLNSATAMYRIHEGNSVDLSKNPYIPRYKGLKRLFFDADYKEIQKHIPRKLINYLLAECNFNMARHFQHVGNKNQMRIKLLKTLKFKPNFRVKEVAYMILNSFSGK